MSIGLLVVPNLANASLIGDTIFGCASNPGVGCLSPGTFNWFTTGTSSGDTAIVTDPGVEFFGPNYDSFNFVADFTGDTVTISYELKIYTAVAAQAFLFTGLEWRNATGTITGLIELPEGELPISGTDFTTSSIKIAVSQTELALAGVKSTTFKILTDTVVPEPATLLLMVLGLAGLGFVKQRPRS